MIPFIILAEKKQRMNTVFCLAIIITALSQFILALTHSHWWLLCLTLFLYFIAFNTLEALLPSLISKQAPPHSKGTAMGIYSTSQFLGLFAGGALSGVLYQWSSYQGIFLINALLASIWGIMSVFLKFQSSCPRNVNNGSV
jgi:MFS family permease